MRGIRLANCNIGTLTNKMMKTIDVMSQKEDRYGLPSGDKVERRKR